MNPNQDEDDGVRDTVPRYKCPECGDVVGATYADQVWCIDCAVQMEPYFDWKDEESDDDELVCPCGKTFDPDTLSAYHVHMMRYHPSEEPERN